MRPIALPKKSLSPWQTFPRQTSLSSVNLSPDQRDACNRRSIPGPNSSELASRTVPRRRVGLRPKEMAAAARAAQEAMGSRFMPRCFWGLVSTPSQKGAAQNSRLKSDAAYLRPRAKPRPYPPRTATARPRYTPPR